MITFKTIKSIILQTSSLIHTDLNSKILFYHDVYDSIEYTKMGTPLGLFEEHIKVIKENKFKIVSFINKKEKQVHICFDDGFHGIWDTKQYFLDNKIFPTVFLAVDLIGKEGYLNKDEILELQSLGFKFQSHAWSHRPLTSFTELELVHELESSKFFLSELLGRPVEEICFPIGFYSDLVILKCKEYGYAKMYTSLPGNYYSNLEKGLYCRNLLQFLSPQDVKCVLRGALNIFQEYYKKKHYIK